MTHDPLELREIIGAVVALGGVVLMVWIAGFLP